MSLPVTNTVIQEEAPYMAFIKSITGVDIEARALEKLVDCSKVINVECALNKEKIDRRVQLPPEYDDATVRPASTLITNKVRLDRHPITIESNGKIVYTVPAKYINDSLKPAADRFHYFSLPPEDGTQNTIETFELDIDRQVLSAYNTQAEMIYEQVKVTNPSVSFRSCIPREIYTHNWKVYNKDFIAGHGDMRGIGLSSSPSRIDIKNLTVLKQLYPERNESILRKDYEYLVALHGLDSNSKFVSTVREPQYSTVVQNAIRIIQDCTNILSLNYTILNATKDVLDKLVLTKFSTINPNNIMRNMPIFKLAFICGSTNETIVKDIAEIESIIRYKFSSFR